MPDRVRSLSRHGMPPEDDHEGDKLIASLEKRLEARQYSHRLFNLIPQNGAILGEADNGVAHRDLKPKNILVTFRQFSDEGGMRDEALDSNDALLSRLAPSFKKHIEDALEPVLGPVVSVLQSHGAAERKQRETFLALEEKKLALRSEKIHLQRRRGGRICQLRRRASSVMSSRLRFRQGLRL